MKTQDTDSKKLLFDQISRKVIIEFYEKSKTKNWLWIWWHQNIIVTQFEVLKVKRDFSKLMIKVNNIICGNIVKHHWCIWIYRDKRIDGRFKCSICGKVK